MEVGSVHDTSIMKAFSALVEKNLNVHIRRSDDSNVDPCVTMQRTATMSSGSFINTLQLTFDITSNSLNTAHETGNRIVEAADEFVATSDDPDLMSVVDLNGLNDGSDGAGRYATTVTLQFRYVAG